MDAHEIGQRVRMILHGILDVPTDQIPSHAHVMNDLGADSWQYLEFRTELEKHFGMLIPDSEVDRLSCIHTCCGLISEYLLRREHGTT
jgi:acyl carrier protein